MPILAEDMKFHEPPDNNPLWAETNFWSFHIPEEKAYVLIYVITRKNLGVCKSDIFVYQDHVESPTEALYYDAQIHLPLPEKLEEYTLANGLSVKTVNAPMEYDVSYEGYDGAFSFNLHFEGLSEPYATHDPDMDPLANADQSKAWQDSAWAHHFEQSQHVTGECTLHGKKYKIDCFSTMDHSWGMRPEDGRTYPKVGDLPNLTWFHGHWGKDRNKATGGDLVIHVSARHDPANTDKLGPLLHGYVVDDGELFGLVEGEGQTKRRRFMPTEIEITVKDVRDKVYKMRGTSVATYPWILWPNLYCFCGHLKWDDIEGLTNGWGESQDCLGMPYVVDAKQKGITGNNQ